MARRKQMNRRGRFRGFTRRAQRSRSSSGGGYKWWEVLLAGGLYGIGRNAIAPAIPDFFAFGPVDSDNAIFGTADFLMMQSGNKYLKLLGTVGLATEGGIIGARAISGMSNNAVASYDAY